MPKRKLTAEEKGDKLLAGLIKKGMDMRGEKWDSVCTALRISHPTFYRRMKEPGEFTLSQLRYFVHHYGFSNQEVADIFGMGNSESDASIHQVAIQFTQALVNALQETRFGVERSFSHESNSFG